MIQGKSVTKVVTTWFEEYEGGGIDLIEIFDTGETPPVPLVGDVIAVSARLGADQKHLDTAFPGTKIEHEFNNTTGIYHVYVTGKAVSK